MNVNKMLKKIRLNCHGEKENIPFTTDMAIKQTASVSLYKGKENKK